MIQNFKFFLFSGLIAATLAACTQPRQKEGDGSATFYVGEVSGTSETVVSSGTWKFPEKKVYNLSACVQDRINETAIRGHKFKIKGGLTTVEVTTREDGCFNWQESFGFDFVADAYYITLKRTIEADGVQKGRRDVLIAVNPWHPYRSTNLGEVIDITPGRSEVPAQLLVPEDFTQHALRGLWRGTVANTTAKGNSEVEASAQIMFGGGEPAPDRLTTDLFIESINLTNRAQGPATNGGVHLEMTLDFEPKMVLEGMQGQQSTYQLKNGEFQVVLYLAASYQKGETDQRVLLTPYQKPLSQKVKVVDGKVVARFQSEILARSNYGTIEAFVRVRPIGLEGVNPFEGLYTIGYYEDLSSGGSGTVQASNHLSSPVYFDLDAFLTSSVDTKSIQDLERGEGGNLPSGVSSVSAFEFSKLNINFYQWVKALEYTTKRTLRLKAGTTVVDGLRGRPVANQLFRVTAESLEPDETLQLPEGYDPNKCLDQVSFERELIKDSPQTFTVMTNHEGYLEMEDQLTFRYYEIENYKRRRFVIEHVDSGAKIEIPFRINPWDYGFTFGFDGRFDYDYKEEAFNETVDDPEAQADLNGVYDERLLTDEDRQRLAEVDRNAQRMADDNTGITMGEEYYRSRFFSADYHHEALRFEYGLDEFLDLKITKHFRVRMNPTILRYSSMTYGRESSHDFRDGIWLVKFALEKNYLVSSYSEVNDPRFQEEELTKRYIGYHQDIVEINRGVMRPTIKFTIDDLRVMRTRANLLAEFFPVAEWRLQRSEDGKHLEIPDQILDYNCDGERNLDDLIDQNAHIKPATFVAPVIPISNGFGSTFLGTDEIPRNRKEIQEFMQNEVEAIQPFYNSPGLESNEAFFQGISHLRDVSVSELIEEAKKRRERIRERNELKSRLVNQLRVNNLEYAQVFNVDNLHERITKEELREANLIISPDDPIHSFHDLINNPAYGEGKKGEPPISTNELAHFVQSGEMSSELAKRMCIVLIRDLMYGGGRLLQEKVDPEAYARNAENVEYNNLYLKDGPIIWDCIHAAKDGKDPYGAFGIHRLLKVYDVQHYYPGVGFSLNFNMNSDISMSFSRSKSTSVSRGFGGTIKFLPAAMAGAALVAGAPVTLPLLGGIAIGNIVGGDGDFFKKSMSVGESSNVGNGISLSSAAYLASQQKHIYFKFLEYEHCLAIKPNFDFLVKSGLYDSLVGSFGPDIGNQMASRGLFMCTGVHEKEPTIAHESYYYLTQHFTEGDMLDNTDLQNNAWLLALRGRGDYIRFMGLLGEKQVTGVEPNFGWDRAVFRNEGSVESVKNLKPQDVAPYYDVGFQPLDELKEAFDNFLPTFPGYYGIHENSFIDGPCNQYRSEEYSACVYLNQIPNSPSGGN